MKFSNLQSLRFFAAFIVVLHHMLPHYDFVGGASFLAVIIGKWGFVGVDVFFVISGFVIANSLHRNEHLSWVQFLSRRAFRIFLGYWPFLVLALILIVVYIPEKLDQLDLLGAVFLTQASMPELPLPVSWSLTYELYFYFLASLSLLIRIKYLMGVLLVYLIALLLVNANIPMSIIDSVYLSPLVMEFCAGGGIYYATKLNTVRHRVLLPCLFVVTCVSFYLGTHFEAQDGLLRIATFGFGASALVAFTVALEPFIKSKGWLVQLGDASYALYLSHLLWIWLFEFSGMRLQLEDAAPMLINISFGALLLFCIAFSYFYYRLVERPLYHAVLDKFGLRHPGHLEISRKLRPTGI